MVYYFDEPGRLMSDYRGTLNMLCMTRVNP
jgi:hypothetical protein